MADRYWVGSGAGVWDDDTRWATSSGGAGGTAVPSAGEDVFFDSGGTGDCTVDITVDIAALTVADSYTGSIINTTNNPSFLFSGNVYIGTGSVWAFGTGTIALDGNGQTFDLAGVAGNHQVEAIIIAQTPGAGVVTFADNAQATSLTCTTGNIAVAASVTLLEFDSVTAAGTFGDIDLTGGSCELEVLAGDSLFENDSFSPGAGGVSVNGSFDIAGVTTWTPGVSPIEFAASGTLKVATGQAIYSLVTIPGATSTVSASGASTVVVTNGITCDGTIAIPTGKTLFVSGGAVTVGALGSITNAAGGTGTFRVNAPGNGEGITVQDGTIDVSSLIYWQPTGSALFGNGTYASPFIWMFASEAVNAINFDGNYNFTGVGGLGVRIQKAGSGSLTVSNSDPTPTYDFAANLDWLQSSADTLLLTGMQGSTWTVAGDLACQAKITASSTWTLNVTGTAVALRTDVQYSNATAGTEIDATDSSNTNSDNNQNWHFIDLVTMTGAGTSTTTSDGAKTLNPASLTGACTSTTVALVLDLVSGVTMTGAGTSSTVVSVLDRVSGVTSTGAGTSSTTALMGIIYRPAFTGAGTSATAISALDRISGVSMTGAGTSTTTALIGVVYQATFTGAGTSTTVVSVLDRISGVTLTGPGTSSTTGSIARQTSEAWHASCTSTTTGVGIDLLSGVTMTGAGTSTTTATLGRLHAVDATATATSTTTGVVGRLSPVTMTAAGTSTTPAGELRVTDGVTMTGAGTSTATAPGIGLILAEIFTATMTASTVSQSVEFADPLVIDDCWSPCECGQGSCEYFSDQFDDSGRDEPGSGWDVRSGDFIFTAEGMATTEANALIVTTTPNPAFEDEYVTTATLKGKVVGDQVRLITNFFDDDRYWFAEVTYGAEDSTLKLWQRNTGSNTQRGETVTLSGVSNGDSVELRVCWRITEDDDGSSVQDSVSVQHLVTSGVAITYQAGQDALTDPVSGFGTGASTTSQATMSSMVLSHGEYRDGCPVCSSQCLLCQESTTPSALVITFSGIVDGSLCTGCTQFNDSFVIEQSTLNPCLWLIHLDDLTVCSGGGIPEIHASLFHDVWSRLYWRVDIYLNSALSLEAMFIAPVGIGREDCMQWDTLDVPISVTGGTVTCTYANATCKITSL